ncbi:TOX high mobility group box family member 4-B [Galendromus occidentalis]|uniref:TOX high mobility group box family member 4-B n=1 Tax=Galendromus occidentalis TaxID=34638 RepID=A0AAJ7PB81_9ACAR|nr:TOX high mobility group box family member 4-B [Galendromus occidentalis]
MWQQQNQGYQQQYTNLGVQQVQMQPQTMQTTAPTMQNAQPHMQQPHQSQQQQQVQELTRESSPMAGSPDSYGTSSGGGPIKKQKQTKKKKDPNEPKKPLSAYAMFFRDTQAAIKGQNPNASFGEVSKIVASMWETLDAEKKNSYKQKADDAKKEYLKALTAYKANLVAQSGGGQDSLPSPPQSAPPNQPQNTFSQTVMIEQHHPAQWAAQQMAQQPQQPVQIIYAQHSNLQVQQPGSEYLNNSNQMHNQYAGHSTLNVQVPMSTGQQMLSQQMHMQQLGQQQSPIMKLENSQLVQQQQQQQASQVQAQPQQQQAQTHQQHQVQQQAPLPQATQAIHVQQQLSESMTPEAAQQQQQAPPLQPRPPSIKTETDSLQQAVQQNGADQRQQAHQQDSKDSFPNGHLNNNEPPLTPTSEDTDGCIHKPMCRRKGCANTAVDCAEWDKEYCSNECVVSHCREVFTNWVTQRQGGQQAGPAVADPYSLRFHLEDNEETRSIWDHSFHITYDLQMLASKELRTSLQVVNTDDSAFDFHFLFHPYFKRKQFGDVFDKLLVTQIILYSNKRVEEYVQHENIDSQ